MTDWNWRYRSPKHRECKGHLVKTLSVDEQGGLSMIHRHECTVCGKVTWFDYIATGYRCLAKVPLRHSTVKPLPSLKFAHPGTRVRLAGRAMGKWT